MCVSEGNGGGDGFSSFVLPLHQKSDSDCSSADQLMCTEPWLMHEHAVVSRLNMLFSLELRLAVSNGA